MVKVAENQQKENPEVNTAVEIRNTWEMFQQKTIQEERKENQMTRVGFHRFRVAKDTVWQV